MKSKIIGVAIAVILTGFAKTLIDDSTVLAVICLAVSCGIIKDVLLELNKD